MRAWWWFLLAVNAAALGRAAEPAVWQWSVPITLPADAPADRTRAFLWIPENCARVRGVVVGQNNMIEEGIFEHAAFRRALTELGFAEVWIAPRFDQVFDFTKGAGERFDAMMHALAAESGYVELAFAPVVPMGHSACASYPWNFAAWNPARTLAILSVKGDAPQTNLTGSGKPNPEWGNRGIDGIPGLMVMGEYEWVEGRLTPGLAFREKHPATPIAFLAEPGRGHFDASDELVEFLARFVRKAAAARLPKSDGPLDQAPVLRAVNPADGWLVERAPLNQPRRFSAAPAARYAGDEREALWCFDEEMARATERHGATQLGKLPQLIGYVQGGKTVPQASTHHQVALRFEPMEEDGLDFRVTTTFLETVDGGSANTTRWTGIPAGDAIGHAAGASPIALSRTTGPAVQTGPDTFRVNFNRTASTTDVRANDIWLIAEHPGDGKFKSAVQQAVLKLPVHNVGAEQRITFPEISEQKSGVRILKLGATSSSGAPVSYYVREGPAFVEGDMLVLTVIPPRSRRPLRVTVVAWQWGRGGERALKAAEPVERSFIILP